MKKRVELRGISLIVLVITIIIIIILAGAVILSLTNSNVISKAKLAKEGNDFTSIRQSVDSEKMNSKFEGGIANYADVIPSSYSADLMVSDLGVIFLKPNPNTQIYDIGNALDKLGGAVMPEGFTHLEGTLQDGIVIQDGDGNEFVWIPVPDFTKFYTVLNFTTFEKYSDTNIKPYNPASATEKAEYDQMRASVEKYKGFYIARYEAGIEGSSSATSTSPVQTGTVKPLSKQGKKVWNFLRWDTSYTTGTLGNDTHNGAVKVARSMYPNVNSLVAYGLPTILTNDTGAISTLIYGEQWDAVMNYMKEVENPNVAGAKYITNSYLMGEYTVYQPVSPWALIKQGTLQSTGSSLSYKVKNIYDMAGNVYEWTMEAGGADGRYVRGGYCSWQSSERKCL